IFVEARGLVSVDAYEQDADGCAAPQQRDTQPGLHAATLAGCCRIGRTGVVVADDGRAAPKCLPSYAFFDAEVRRVVRGSNAPVAHAPQESRVSVPAIDRGATGVQQSN